MRPHRLQATDDAALSAADAVRPTVLPFSGGLQEAGPKRRATATIRCNGLLGGSSFLQPMMLLIVRP
jgi:hypothetical protein